MLQNLKYVFLVSLQIHCYCQPKHKMTTKSLIYFLSALTLFLQVTDTNLGTVGSNIIPIILSMDK